MLENDDEIATESEQSFAMSIKRYTIYSLKNFVPIFHWLQKSNKITAKHRKQEQTDLLNCVIHFRWFLVIVMGFFGSFYFWTVSTERTLMESEKKLRRMVI